MLLVLYTPTCMHQIMDMSAKIQGQDAMIQALQNKLEDQRQKLQAAVRTAETATGGLHLQCVHLCAIFLSLL